MIDHETLCSDAARARTRVSAFLPQASPVAAAVRVYGTLRPAVRRAADVIFQARAGRYARVAAVAASGEGTARGWHARIRRRRRAVFIYLCKRMSLVASTDVLRATKFRDFILASLEKLK